MPGGACFFTSRRTRVTSLFCGERRYLPVVRCIAARV
jgi:hypothetical protein